MAEQETGPAAGGGGSILTRKTGPLANWIWMAIILLVALVYSVWRRNRAASAGVPDEVVEEPGDQTAPPVFILPQNPQPTVPITINNPVTPPTAPPVATKPPPGGGIEVLPIDRTLKAGVGWIYVEPGDTVGSLAKKGKISLEKFAALNSPEKLNRLTVGEVVRIRSVAGPAPASRARK